MDGVGKRMRKAMERGGFDEAAIALRLDIQKRTINNYLNDKSEPKFQTLVEFCETVDCSFDDILSDNNPDQEHRPKVDQSLPTDFRMVDVIGARLSAGAGANSSVDRIVTQMGFDRQWLSRQGVDPDRAKIVTVDGDSMVPTLEDKALVMVDLRDTMPTDKPRIYAYRNGTDLFVKRLELVEKDEKKIVVIKSDNPLHASDFVNETDEQFEVIGRVVWTARTIKEKPPKLKGERQTYVDGPSGDYNEELQKLR